MWVTYPQNPYEAAEGKLPLEALLRSGGDL